MARYLSLSIVLLLALIMVQPDTSLAQWVEDGVPICTATGSQYAPQLVSDGSGGAIITWQDTRSGNGDIYAQRVSGSGTAQWTTNGVPICMASGVSGSTSACLRWGWRGDYHLVGLPQRQRGHLCPEGR